MYKNFRRLMGLYKPIRGHLVLSQLCLFLAVATNLVIASLNGRLVNQGVQAGDVDRVINIAMWMIGLTLVYTLFTIGNSIYAVLFAEGTAHWLRNAAYRKIQTLSFGNLDRFRTGDLLVRLTTDINNVKLAVLYALLMLLLAPFTILLVLVATAILSPAQLPMMIGLMVVFAAIVLFLMRGLQQLFVMRQRKMESVNNVLQEGMSGVRVVKAMVREEFESERYASAATELRDAALAPAYRMALFLPTAYALLYGSIGVILLVAGREVLVTQTLSLGEVVVFLQLMAAALAPVAMLAYMLPFLEAGEASLERIYEIIDDTAEVQDAPSPAQRADESFSGRIVFENVSFGYGGGTGKGAEEANQESASHDKACQDGALKGINLTIEPGQTVGFLGATGAGKSSLVNLIPRFYDVTEGRVLLDGVDVREIPQEQLRRLVAIALQEAVLFSGTVRGNVLTGRPDGGDRLMEESARAADADAFVSAIPEQYGAEVKRRGANFSGGQRQRLSIARAVATRPRVLILDDSTSALDMATEARVQGSVQELMGTTTKLYVAQRISTVLNADRIVLLDGGRQVAVGTHNELARSSPLYQEICMSQLGMVPLLHDGSETFPTQPEAQP